MSVEKVFLRAVLSPSLEHATQYLARNLPFSHDAISCCTYLVTVSSFGSAQVRAITGQYKDALIHAAVRVGTRLFISIWATSSVAASGAEPLKSFLTHCL